MTQRTYELEGHSSESGRELGDLFAQRAGKQLKELEYCAEYARTGRERVQKTSSKARYICPSRLIGS